MCMSGGARSGGGRDAGATGGAEVQPRHDQGGELDRGAEEERRADAPVAARQVRHRHQERRADDRRDHRHQALQRAHRAHRAALRRRVGGAGDDALDRRRDGEAEDVAEDHRVDHPALRRCAPGRDRRASTTPADDRQALRREALEKPAQQHALHQRRHAADREQRPAVVLRPPAELEGVVEHPARVEDELRKRGAGDHRDQDADAAEPAELGQRGDRIERRSPRERAALLRRQRLGQDEPAVEQVEQRQRAGGEERQAQVDRAEQPAHDRAEDEAEAEHGAEQSEALGAVFGRRDVGDVGVGDRRVRLHRAAEQAHDDQHPERRRHRGDEEAERERAEADQQHRPAAEAVGQRAEDRRRDEVGDAEGERHRAVPPRLVGLRRREAADQRRQHRHDQADRHHVDQHRDHDERHRRLAPAGVAGGCGGRWHARHSAR